MQNTPLEIERKFLIEYPDTEMLSEVAGCKIKDIAQTYLSCENGTLRVRKSVCDGKTVYKFNEKHVVSDVSRTEQEREICEKKYLELLKDRDNTRRTIEKVRYAFPYCAHIMEIDIYPFWNDRAILEIELKSEDEKYEIPHFLRVIKEVTTDKRYSNKALARCIITEDISPK